MCLPHTKQVRATMIVTEKTEQPFNFSDIKKGASKLVMVSALFALAGCSTPDWVNPMNWFGDDEEELAAAEAVPAPDSTAAEYPKLGDAPAVPGKTVSIQEADQIQRGLKADRDQAKYTDQQLRADTSVQGLPQPKPAVAPQPVNSDEPPLPTAAPSQPVQSAPLTQPAPVVAAAPAQTQVIGGNFPAAQQPGGVKLMPNPAPVTSPQDAYARLAPGSNTVVISGNGVQDVFQKQLAASHSTVTTLPASTQFQSVQQLPLNNSAVAVAPIVRDVYNQPVASAFGTTPTSFGVLGNPDAVIHFQTGSARLGAGDIRKLKAIASAQRQSGAMVKVVGHASSRTRELPVDRHKLVNLRISQQRASVVVQGLINQGVAPQNIITESRSDSMPVTREAMPSDEAKNRRTEIFLVR